jgi:tRNA (guanine10-N2)-dimethyltransferase
VAKLFLLLSGEHATLPASELKAILEAEGYAFKTLEKLDQVLRLEAHSNCVEALRHRAAFTRLCGLELLNCEAEASVIVKAVRSASLKEVLKDKESFAVRVRRVKNYASKINGMHLERKLGKIILTITEKSRVNLKNPDKTFIGVLTQKKFIFGVKLAEFPPKQFAERRPKEKPFFHPSAMQAKLARCMVNLAKPKVDELVLDPFCGTGSTLIESALIGCRALGLDVQRRMVRGTLKNAVHFGINPEGVIVADARNPPITTIGCLVTDPPYGRSATTLNRTTKQIVEEVLMAVYDMMGKGRRVCMAAPKTLNIQSVGTALGYNHLESHFVYVHRSLTREIAVFEKV